MGKNPLTLLIKKKTPDSLEKNDINLTPASSDDLLYIAKELIKTYDHDVNANRSQYIFDEDLYLEEKRETCQTNESTFLPDLKHEVVSEEESHKWNNLLSPDFIHILKKLCIDIYNFDTNVDVHCFINELNSQPFNLRNNHWYMFDAIDKLLNVDKQIQKKIYSTLYLYSK